MLCDNVRARLRAVGRREGFVCDVYYSPLNSCTANTAACDCCGAMLMMHNKKKIISEMRISASLSCFILQ